MDRLYFLFVKDNLVLRQDPWVFELPLIDSLLTVRKKGFDIIKLKIFTRPYKNQISL